MSLCGSQFWDLNRTWHSPNPDFTPCFEETVLAWIPIGFLWLFAGVDLYYCRHSSSAAKIPWNPLNITKVVLVVVLALLQIFVLGRLGYLGIQYNQIIYLSAILTPVLRTLTFGLVVFLILSCKRHGIRSSGIQFLFWFLMTVCEVFGFRTTIDNIYEDATVVEDMGFVVAKLLFFPLVVTVFLLNCWADPATTVFSEQNPPSQNLSPEAASSFLSSITFFWFEKLAWLGYKKPLETSDLWDLNPEDKSSALVPLFQRHWRPSADHVTKETKRGSLKIEPPQVGLLPAPGNKKKQEPTSILPTLVSVYGSTFLLGAFLKLIQDLLTFASPQILKLLITYVEAKDAVGGDETWKGFFYAALLLATTTCQTLILNQYFQQMFLLGMRVRSTLVNVILRKSLVISSSSRKESTTGEIVNLQSVDSQRLMDMMPYVNMIWSGPLQIGLSLYFLWAILGPSVLAGLGVMILLIPVNAYIASKVETLQVKQMKLKDERVKNMNEFLAGIKVLKLCAWEQPFASQVMGIRDKEMHVLKTGAYINAATTFVWNCAPFLVAVASFASFVLSDPKNVLDAQTAFVALSLFNILRFPMAVLPMIISTLVQANVSLKRINKFMNSEEIDADAVTHDPQEVDPIVVEQGFFSWDPKDEQPFLKNINMRVPEGSLVAICGTVGSGKSSILSAILGEMFKKSGHVNTKGSFAYVAQQAWIQNATVRDNILFGLRHDSSRYEKVLDSCALRPDLEILNAGDRTEIGEKGINLSGGQKQRISVARAVYNNADVYLFDDPLSAVDSHVGKHIFDQVLGPKGLLKRKTRVLVTHGVTYLPQVDKIIVVKDGQITETGSYRELLERKGAFADFLTQHLGSDSADEDEEEASAILHDLQEVVGIKVDMSVRRRSRGFSESDSVERYSPRKESIISHGSSDEGNGGTAIRHRKVSVDDSSAFPTKKRGDASNGGRLSLTPEDEKLIQAETSETGNVQWTIYLHYLRAIGWGMTFITVLAYTAFQGLAVASDMWLSIWSNANTGLNTTGNAPNQPMYLGVYGGLGIGQGIGTLTAAMVFAYGSLRASNLLHAGMLERIMRAPMSFFDTTPIGRIVNRFSKDVDVCDNMLRMNLETFLSCMLNVVAVFVVISYSTPIFMTVIIPVGILYFIIQRFYVATSRQLKRLESVSRSPIYSHFSEILTGCSTIRAYAVQERFTLESEAKVDSNQMCYFPSIVANRWLAVRLETLGNLIIFFAALFAVLQRETLSPGLVGLSISYALEVTQVLNWMVRMSSDLETDIVAVERIQEYTHIAQEADWEVPGRKPSPNWPEKGEIVFNNYETRYREGLDPVLRGITCKINPSEKVGVVGRTGAGKSSLTLALFRIIEPTMGNISVDGQDIYNMGLHDLRSRLTIIPQEPVLFCGTLRFNLDPFAEYSDTVVWRSLELAHLKTFVRGLGAGLAHEIAEGGENLSVGQRQLICLARALLRKSKILVLDEATAAVDLETDDLIQQTIRTEFSDCTIVTIAHRLNTIMEYNRVIVLDKGEIREFDSPQVLLQNKNSIFYGMAKDAGLV